jgi:hypothetical protein
MRLERVAAHLGIDDEELRELLRGEIQRPLREGETTRLPA